MLEALEFGDLKARIVEDIAVVCCWGVKELETVKFLLMFSVFGWPGWAK